MKKLFFITSLSFVLLSSLFVCGIEAVKADPTTGPYLGLKYGEATGLGQEDIRFTVARVISVALGLLGIIAVVLVIYAGFKWMTAGGNEENAASARKILFAAVIGLVIILAAYSLVRFVMTSLFKATTGYDYSVMQD